MRGEWSRPGPAPRPLVLSPGTPGTPPGRQDAGALRPRWSDDQRPRGTFLLRARLALKSLVMTVEVWVVRLPWRHPRPLAELTPASLTEPAIIGPPRATAELQEEVPW